MQDFKKLLVWQKSIEFVSLVYRLTKIFPKDELYGLTSQLRRASVSVPANITEGSTRQTTKELLRFLYISNGSLNECKCYFEITKNLEMINQVQYDYIYKKSDEIGYLLNMFIKSLKK